MTSATPDVLGPLLVYRYFTISEMGTLASLSYSHHWQPGWNDASCGSGCGAEHRMPAPILAAQYFGRDQAVMAEIVHGEPASKHCLCGFYAYYFPGQFHQLSDPPDTASTSLWPSALWHNYALAAVLVKGRVQFHSHGLRAQHMKILAVSSFSRHHLLKLRRAGQYGGLVNILPDPVALLAAHPPQDHSALVGSNVTPWAFGPPVAPSKYITITSYVSPGWTRPGRFLRSTT